MDKRQFFNFLVCGGLAALVNVGTRWVLSLWMPYSIAIVIAYLAGMLSAYILFKVFVFSSVAKKRDAKEAGRFVFVNLLALIQIYVISIVLSEWVLPFIGIEKYRYDIAHMIGVGVPAVTSYFFHKYFTFKTK